MANRGWLKKTPPTVAGLFVIGNGKPTY